jgi:hypothetical protein
MDWGGFVGVKPLDKTPFVPTSSSSPVDNKAVNTITSPHMRRALSKWAELLKRDDPSMAVQIDVTSSPPPETTTPLSPEVLHDDPPTLELPKEWDPLPPSPTPPITNTAPLYADPTLHETPSPPPTPPPSRTAPKASRYSRKQRILLSAKDTTGRAPDAPDVLLKKGRKWADDGTEKQEEEGGFAGRVKKLFGGWL